MGNRFITFAAISGFLAIAVGAFAAHQLSAEQLDWIEKGWRYQVMHTLSLLAIGLYVSATQQQEMPRCRRLTLNFTALFWGIGILCFSFGLYALALTGNDAIRAIVPVGGTSFMIGWAILAGASLRSSLAKRGK